MRRIASTDELAAHGEALQHYRDLGGDVEQRQGEQGRGLVGRRVAVLRGDPEHHQRLCQVIEDALHHAAMVGERAFRLAGRSRGEQDRRVVGGSDRRERDVSVSRERRQRLIERQGIVDRHHRRGDAGEALGTRSIGEHEAAIDLGDRGGEFLRLPPAVEKGGDAACHDHAHVEHDPRWRIAHRDADAHTLGEMMGGQQRLRDTGGRRVDLRKGQPFVAGDEEGLVGMFVAIMREIQRQGGRRHGDYRIVAAVTLRCAERQHAAGTGQRGHGCVHTLIEGRAHISLHLV
jgi:hypothetical protein